MLKRQFKGNETSFIFRLSLTYIFLFLIVGIFLPFFPLWLKWKQLTDQEISIVLAAPLFARVLFTPSLSFWADSIGNYKFITLFISGGAVLASLLLLVSKGFWSIFFVALLFSICWTTIIPLIETIAMRGVRQKGVNYGTMRLWGSLSFIAASFLLGYLIDVWERGVILYTLIGSNILLLLCLFFLPSESKSEKHQTNKVLFKEIYSIVRLPVFLAFLVGASLIQTTHTVFYAFGTIHWQSQGISSTYIGGLWALGVIAEIVLFIYTRHIVDYFGPVRLLLFAGLAAVVRWLAMSFDPGLVILSVLQCLHAFTFGLSHLGAIYFISIAIPEKYSATIQGLYAAFSIGFFMGLATLVSGTLYVHLEGMAYLVMAVIGMISIGFNYYVLRVWNGGLLVSSNNGKSSVAV